MDGIASIQPAGIVLAVVTVATIGAGHVLVRRLHARFGTRPAVVLFILGGLLLTQSLFLQENLFSGILGITGVTVVWDGIEMFRQEKRARRSAQG